ncbi:hypothetical protein LSAT2_024061 [Lamellibrachia satsuma]|nr:hypothetical protein LSAT2_024061 [Lamellibrachia satsuma]
MQTSQDDSWSYKEAKTMNQTRLIIDVLSYELYDMKITAINNKNISSTSESLTADLRTTPTTIVMTTPLRRITPGTVAGDGEEQINRGLWSPFFRTLQYAPHSFECVVV